jgi:hypothetical protein
MATNYILIDSTCLFSQRSLLDSIKNPKDDVIIFLGSSFNVAWFETQIVEFSQLAPFVYPDLASFKTSNPFELENYITRLLHKEQEKLLQTINIFKDNGLLKIYDFDDLQLPLDTKNRDEKYFRDYFQQLKMNALKTLKKTQYEMKLMPSDIDAIAYALANNTTYHSENPKIADGTLAETMGFKSTFLYETTTLSPELISPRDLLEFIEDKKSFSDKMKSKIKMNRTHFKIFKIVANCIINLIPVISSMSTVTNSVKDINEYRLQKRNVRKNAIFEI